MATANLTMTTIRRALVACCASSSASTATKTTGTAGPISLCAGAVGQRRWLAEGKSGEAAAAADNEDAGGAAAAAAEGSGGDADQMNDIEELKSKLESVQRELEEARAKRQHALADVQNILQRTEKQVAAERRFGGQGLAKSMIEVADNLERALESVPAEELETADGAEVADPKRVRELLRSLHAGVKLTESMLQNGFRKNGVTRFDPTGEAFDPNLHMAMFKVPDASKDPNTVHSCTKVGYMLHERVVRPAEVGVVLQPAAGDGAGQ